MSVNPSAIILRKGEAEWPWHMPVDVGREIAETQYVLVRYVWDSYDDASRTVTLPSAPFSSRDQASWFLKFNWPNWLGECDVHLEERVVYQQNDDGSFCYDRDVTLQEIFDGIAAKVNKLPLNMFDELAGNFYEILVQGGHLSREDARHVEAELMSLKRQWIQDEPERLRLREEAKQRKGLSGLHPIGEGWDRESDLVLRKGMDFILDAGILLANANCTNIMGLMLPGMEQASE